MRNISVCYTNYNRVELLLDSFENIYDVDEITEIVVSDDHSEKDNFELLEKYFEHFPKVKHFRNDINLDCYFNKHRAIKLASNDWCCLWDSDNTFGFDYINRLFQIQGWDENTAYLPSFAAPHFDYRRFEGLEITKENVANYINDPTCSTMLNTMNYFVNRNFYMKCWDGDFNPYNCDSIYMNYLWLKNGGKLYVVPGLTYQHRVDNHQGEESGHYNSNTHKTPIGLHESILQKLRELK